MWWRALWPGDDLTSRRALPPDARVSRLPIAVPSGSSQFMPHRSTRQLHRSSRQLVDGTALGIFLQASNRDTVQLDRVQVLEFQPAFCHSSPIPIPTSPQKSTRTKQQYKCAYCNGDADFRTGAEARFTSVRGRRCGLATEASGHDACVSLTLQR